MDFAEFLVAFGDEPDVRRRVWLFSFVLGYSRWLWGRFCANQKLGTVLRCHVDAFEACGGATAEVLYDRMKTAVLGEQEDGTVVYNPSLVALLGHYGSAPRACRAYRAKTKGKVERPFRYIRQDFFLDRSFRNLEDLNVQFDAWRSDIANERVHGTTNRVVSASFAEERPHLHPLPLHPYDAVLTVERRVSHEGMVSVDGNLYSVPDRTRKRAARGPAPSPGDPDLRGWPTHCPPPGAAGQEPAAGGSGPSQETAVRTPPWAAAADRPVVPGDARGPAPPGIL